MAAQPVIGLDKTVNMLETFKMAGVYANLHALPSVKLFSGWGRGRSSLPLVSVELEFAELQELNHSPETSMVSFEASTVSQKIWRSQEEVRSHTRMVTNKHYSPEWLIWGMFAVEFDASIFSFFFFGQEGGAGLLKPILCQFFNWSLYADAPYSRDTWRI